MSLYDYVYSMYQLGNFSNKEYTHLCTELNNFIYGKSNFSRLCFVTDRTFDKNSILLLILSFEILLFYWEIKKCVDYLFAITPLIPVEFVDFLLLTKQATLFPMKSKVLFIESFPVIASEPHFLNGIFFAFI